MKIKVLVFLAGLALCYGRIAPIERKFNSTAVEDLLRRFLPRFKDPELAQLFENCFPNTLDTTVYHFTPKDNSTGLPDAFIVTGDITAQWLRDSTNQVAPYIPLAKQDPALKALICGLIRRQSADILIDPYANAFNLDANGEGHQSDQRTPPMTRKVFEGKYELDSLLAALKLANLYFDHVGETSCFDSPDRVWFKAVRLAVDVIKTQMKGTDEEGERPPYKFARHTTVATDTLMLQSRGPPARRCGMSKSYFRPSDDATSLPLHVPSNAMAVVELLGLAAILSAPGPTYDSAFAAEVTALAREIDASLRSNALFEVDGTTVFAYEVDCFGGRVLMDDANVPSLLSLPYLGYLDAGDPVYRHTRARVWSDRNPYFFSGTAGAGIGGPHIGMGFIWPMSLIMKAHSSNDDSEIKALLHTIKTSSAGTGFMHESFWKDDPRRFTRSWFAWANSMLGELIVKVAYERPYLIFKEATLGPDERTYRPLVSKAAARVINFRKLEPSAFDAHSGVKATH